MRLLSLWIGLLSLLILSVFAANDAQVNDCIFKCQEATYPISCQAECLGVPSPTVAQIQQNQECFNNCQKLTGPIATSQCYQKCVLATFLTPNPAAPPNSNDNVSAKKDSSSSASAKTNTFNATSPASKPTSSASQLLNSMFCFYSPLLIIIINIRTIF